MSPEALFKLANPLALAGWLVLIFFGRRPWAARLVSGLTIPLLLALAYCGLLLTHLGESNGNFKTLDGVAALFQNPWLLLAGWIHYLAFDLFIGSWEVRDAEIQRIPQLAVIPCLILTFLFGPVGLLAYCLLRFALRKTIRIAL